MPDRKHSTNEQSKQSAHAHSDFAVVKKQFDDTVKEAGALQVEYINRRKEHQSFLEAVQQLLKNIHTVNGYKSNSLLYQKFKDTIQNALADTDFSSLEKKCDKLVKDIEPQIKPCKEPVDVMVSLFERNEIQGTTRAVKNKDTEALQKAIAAMKSDMENVRTQWK